MKSSARTDGFVQLVVEYAHGTMLTMYAAKRCCLEITVQNVNGALSECLHWLLTVGVERASRNGPVLYSPEPVLVTYRRPTERVLFSPLRDANPFFHLVGDALWCLAGRHDIAWPVYFNRNYAQYSDDGSLQRAAYGPRWRHWFKYDQLLKIAEELKRNPESRRCVLAMWDGAADLTAALAGTRDAPCNTHAYFERDPSGALNLTVCNRSNDLLWGLAGANAVQFSVLQEYVAAVVGCPVGAYRQFTNNLHIYLEVTGSRERMRALATDAAAHDYYLQDRVKPFPLVENFERWNRELAQFMRTPDTVNWLYTEPFFRDVAVPMYAAWKERKEAGLNGLGWAEKIAAPDWHTACVDWIKRREAKKAAQNA